MKYPSRYDRQVSMAEIDTDGQARLIASKVLVVGAGGLGSPLLYYLAAAGVGEIHVADFDVVEESNLNRQILHDTLKLGTAKVDSALDSLQRLNPDIALYAHPVRVDENNIDGLISEMDLVLDAVDSFGAKLVMNDGCVRRQKPFIHAGATGWKGQIYLYRPDSACLRCFFPPLPQEMKGPLGLGILGAVAGIIGTMQALLAVRYLVNPQSVGLNQLMTFDGQTMRQQLISVTKQEGCAGCSQ